MVAYGVSNVHPTMFQKNSCPKLVESLLENMGAVFCIFKVCGVENLVPQTFWHPCSQLRTHELLDLWLCPAVAKPDSMLDR